MVRVFLLLAVGLILSPEHGLAASKAADYLLNQELIEACQGRGGRIRFEGFIERDLTGDGRKDLIISHDAIECNGDFRRSPFCGAQVCTIKIYVRRGKLLKLEEEFLALISSIGAGPVPVISLYFHGGGQGQLRWNGRAFQ